MSTQQVIITLIVCAIGFTIGDDYKKVYSWYKAWKEARKYGKGSEIAVKLFERRRNGSISFWNHLDTYLYEPEK